jgi:TolB-like protein/DNA-binding winged helix-turn-helix (wHTH) protein
VPIGAPNPTLLRFGSFEMDPDAGELRRAGVLLKLQPQPFKVLRHLADNAGRVVTRDELQAQVWPEGTFVDFERGLNYCILQIRTALGDDAESPRFVQTVPKRGYRFLAPVERVNGSAPAQAARAEPAAAEVEPAAPDAPAADPPSAEPATARAFAVGPRRRALLSGLVGLALIVGLASLLAYLARPRTSPDGARTMLAVLPFEALGSEPGQELFSDGLTEEVITHVGRMDPAGLGVIARTSVMRFKGARGDVRAIGRALGVDYVLEGSVRREADRVRVTAQLIRVSDQTHLWAETYDRTLPGALTIQEEVAARVAASLATRLLEDPGERSRPKVLEAYDAYLRGRALAQAGGLEELRKSLGLYEQAIRLDPGYAPAHAAVAHALHLLRMRGALPPSDAYGRARTSALRAVELDPSLPEAHTALAAVHLWSDWDLDAADAELARALARNPSDPVAHHDRAWALVARGRFDEAVAAIRRAQQLDPLSPRANVDVGWVYLRTRRYDDAIEQCRRTLEVDPAFGAAQACLGEAYMRKGMLSEAVVSIREALVRSGLPADARPALDPGDAAASLRRATEWRLERLLAAPAPDPYSIAAEQARLGRPDEALQSLEDALAARAPMMVLIESDPSFEGLKSDPRFEEVLQRVRGARRP